LSTRNGRPRSVEAVVVGGGPAGLATAAMLERAGVSAVVLEREPELAATWRRNYDRLKLHTVRWLSDLPGMPLPYRYGKWVPRDDLVRYFEDYARAHVRDLRLGIAVLRIDRSSGGWAVDTSDGPYLARDVVLATGYNNVPYVPPWPGRAEFEGELIHSSEYRNPDAYRDRSVVVVGSGNSGAEIATDLAEGGAREVLLSVRTPPNVTPRAVFGLPSQAMGLVLRRLPTAVDDLLIGVTKRLWFGDLTKHGLPPAPRGPYTQLVRDDVVPVLDVGFVRALKRGWIDVVPAVERFETHRTVILKNGTRVRPDAVIAATGYRFGLEPILGHLGILDNRGHPRRRDDPGGKAAEGLWFVGFTNPITGNIREMGIEARIVAGEISAARSRDAGDANGYGPPPNGRSSLAELPLALAREVVQRAAQVSSIVR
jgi:putative flavoprotein involved in K+ transport